MDSSVDHWDRHNFRSIRAANGGIYVAGRGKQLKQSAVEDRQENKIRFM